MSGTSVKIDGWLIERHILDEVDRDLRQHSRHKLRRDLLREKVAHAERRLQYIYQESAGPPDGMPRGSGVSNPTLAKAEQIDDLREKMGVWLEEIEDLDLWLSEVDAVRATLDEAHMLVIDQLYLLPREERLLTCAGIANRLVMSEREVYRAKDEALLEFALVLRWTEVRAANPNLAKVEKRDAS